ncbi:MAG: conjugative transposon protein TraK [Sphingobacteriales bacterium 50-39]|nr:conjugative transposon protein TraK [Sphingobacteriales bacterium]OJW59365.1 MAG: conjugative transposon protein TraK [Sphingobacteriales bacterium 50-39]
MFKKLKNIDTAFRHVRGFSIAFLAACVLLTSFAVYKSYEASGRASQRIFILANGKTLEAFAADRKDNIPVEAKDHIRTFHRLFFSLDPDDKVIQDNINKALYLADASARRMYGNLKEAGYFTNIIAGNISQEITVDSISLDVNQYPYHFRCFATEQIIRSSSVLTRSLVTEGFLRNVARSENNSHGFLIERLETIENKDIKVQNR